jgi:PAS domain S-box-containing protein
VGQLLTPSANIEHLFESAPGCIAVVRGPEHVFEIANAAYRRLVGRTDLIGRRAADVLPELAEQGYLSLLDDVYRSGEAYFADTAPVSFQREPGAPCEMRYISFVYQPIKDETGTVTGIFAEGIDVTRAHEADAARRDAERALREHEAHLSAFFRQSAAGMSETDSTGRFLRVNDRFCEITGRVREELLSLRMHDITHPEDLPGNVPLFDRASSGGGSFDIEKRYIRGDGSEVWVHNSVTTVLDEAGEPSSTICVTIDLTDRKKAEQHQALLINELNHRVKNMLAIVQGIAAQSFKGRDIPEAARQAFDGRLGALSAAHNILTRQNWESASIRQIIEDTVAPHRTRADRFVVEGPDLNIPPKTAVSLALAVHELATNAGKYGALSEAAGQVEIRWVAEDGRLKLVWRERGGPPVEPPSRRGFGTRMIERGLAAELGGAVKIDFRSEGVVCNIDAPLPG